MDFRLVPKSVTLNGAMAIILRYFAEFRTVRLNYRSHTLFKITSADKGQIHYRYHVLLGVQSAKLNGCVWIRLLMLYK